MIRLLHAADLHLDSAFSGLDARKAMLMRETQRRQLDVIRELSESCDLILLSGDLFDSARSFGETETALQSFFRRVRVPVFIAPGNHDYYSEYGAWSRLQLPEHVHIFKNNSPECVRLPEIKVRVWGAGFRSRSSGAVLEGFHAERDGSLNLMVLHGEVCTGESRYNPITREQIAASGLDYLALGHVHSFSGKMRDGDTFWAYPGCTMGRGFDETGEKGLILAEVGEAQCELRFQPLQGHRYEVCPVDVTGLEEPMRAVEERLPEDSEDCICRILLQGETNGSLNLTLLRDLLSERCWQAELEDHTTAGGDLWSIGEENSLRGALIRRLRVRYEQAEDAETAETLLLAARLGLAALEGREG